ncbi:MAG: S8 family serine peptidase [Clostridia bacterium]|nr:S8 family serine peptidase [Clostridia bacterium]
MEKRIFQKWLVSSLLIVCFVCAMLFLLAPSFSSQPSTGPEIHYYYDSADALAEAADSAEFVSAIEPSENVNSVYVLDYEPYDKSFAQFTDLKASKAEVDSIMEDFRAESKAYYSSKNQEFLSSIGVDANSQDYQVVASDYSPYVQITYEDTSAFQKYENVFIDGVKTNSDISEIHVSTPIELKEQAATTSSETRYDMNDALKDIGADDQTYTGSGQIVGIMEAEGVTTDNSHSELAHLNIRAAGDSSTDSEHAEYVTRLICGSEGVARGISTVYIYHAGYASSYIKAMNWFIDNSCLVVNASMGRPADAGKYTWTSAFMDFQVRYNRVIFVASAGNEGAKSNHYVNPPATGYNAITVANSTKDAYIKNTSSYDVESDINMNKPTLAAPGTGLYLNGSRLVRDINKSNSGTSLSAPIVTGIILKLLEESPGLQIFPEAVSAVLIASATGVYRQTDSWDDRAGAGIVNYQRARSVVNNSCCVFYNSNNSQGIVISPKEFTAKGGNKIRAVAIWSANSKTNAWGGNVRKNIHTNYDLILNFVGTSDVLMKQASGKTNMEFFEYTVVLLPKSNFRLDLKQVDKKIVNDDDYGAIAWYVE